MPLGLQKGIVMTMSRNAGSTKNDKKFNMREIVIDTETTGLDPLDGVHRAARAKSLATAPARRFRQPAGLYVVERPRAVNHDHVVGAGGVSGCAPSIDGRHRVPFARTNTAPPQQQH
jgi:hypothetical protein